MNSIATAVGASTPPALRVVTTRPPWRERLRAATEAAETANRRPCPSCGGPTDLVPFYVGGRGWVRYVMCERDEAECGAPMREASYPEDYL